MGDPDQPTWRSSATATLHAALVLKNMIEDRLLEAESLLLADNEALLNLHHNADPPRMSDIAERLILSRGGTTKVIDRLEAMGYAQRRPDANDRRATVVAITPEGEETLVRARKVIDDCLEEVWAKHIDPTEADTVIAVMTRFLHDTPHH